MHVGVYTECLSRPYTGVEVYTHSVVEGLRGKVELTCFHSKNQRHPRFEGVRHHEFRAALPVPFHHRFAAFFHNACFNDLDVLHLSYPNFPYVKKPEVPVVVTVHDLIPVFMPQFHNWKRVVFFKKMLPWYLKKVDAVIAISNSTKRDILRYYKIPEEKISVVYNAIPPVQYVRRKKEDYVLYLGTLEPRKNVEGILKAFALLKSKGFPYKLVVAGGKGWKYQSIFVLVKRLGLENDVVFKGYVSDSEKAALYQKASLFVLPSFYEGFGFTVLEAMAHGTPVVASGVSSLPEIVGDAAVLVNPHDTEDIAAGMLEALSSSDELVKKGLKRARVFSLKNMVREVCGVYEQVV